jgi:hypothetical protein
MNTYKKQNHLSFQFWGETLSNQARVGVGMFRDVGYQHGYTQVLIDVMLAPHDC